ncbi:MAG TPA: 50S ribosomal protein L13 [Clostridiales bacterium]|nr:50S ribosomal protein L13 [Clostridiales bacterium]
MRTYVAKPSEIQRRWYVVDAEGKTLGRLASRIAAILRGKHKPTYTPFLDTGDYVIVINADKVVVTGDKAEGKLYYRHSGYPGGLKTTTFRRMMQTRPERVIEIAVRGMLPHNRLGRAMAKKLKVYAGPVHPHEAQQPEELEL